MLYNVLSDNPCCGGACDIMGVTVCHLPTCTSQFIANLSWVLCLDSLVALVVGALQQVQHSESNLVYHSCWPRSFHFLARIVLTVFGFTQTDFNASVQKQQYRVGGPFVRQCSLVIVDATETPFCKQSVRSSTQFELFGSKLAGTVDGQCQQPKYNTILG